MKITTGWAPYIQDFFGNPSFSVFPQQKIGGVFNFIAGEKRKAKGFRRSLLMALLLLIICAGCTGNNPYALYQKAYKGYAKSEQAEIKTETIMVMQSAEGGKLPFVTYLDIKAVMEKDAPRLYMDMSSDVIQKHMTSYYEDGMLYTDFEGEKTKEAVPFEEVRDTFYLTQFELDKQYIQSSETEETQTGKTIRFVMDPAMRGGWLDGKLMGMSENFGLDYEKISLSNLRFTARLDKKGVLERTEVSFEAQLDFDGEVVPFSYQINSDIFTRGYIIIDPPEDLDAYEE